MKKLIIILLAIMLAQSSALAVKAWSAGPDKKETEKILVDLEQYARQLRQEWGTPGMAIAVVKDGETVYAKGFGVKELGGSDLVDTETIFQIGSTSKAFTGVLVGMMKDEEKFSWKDKVIDHLPDFRMYDSWVTAQFMIEDLMAQRSGMASYAGDIQSELGFDRNHIIRSIRYMKPASSFRSEFAYVNNLLLVAAKLVEKYTGKSWQENVGERIFEPLGMNNTSATSDALMQAENRVSLHSRDNGKVVSVPMDSQSFSCYVYGPAGGVNSNVIDMAKWLKFHINRGTLNGKRLIKEETLDFMQTPKTIADYVFIEGKSYYCEAWVYTEYDPYPIIWHNGETSGNKTMLAFMPEAGIGIIVLSNMTDCKMPEAIAHRFFDLYFNNTLRDLNKEWLAKTKKKDEQEASSKKQPSSIMPAMSYENYIGTYQNPAYGDIEVILADKNLYMTMGPAKIKISLTHYNRDTFLAGEPISDFVSLQLDPDGIPEGIVIDILKNDGNQFFPKKESDKVIKINAGNNFTITLDSNAATGYKWEIANSLDVELVKLLDSKYIPSKTDIVGAPGKEEWTFKAIKSGKAIISFNYARPWDKKTLSAQSDSYIVIINKE